MRKWLFIGTMALSLACIGGYLYFHGTATDPDLPENLLNKDGPNRVAKNDGDAEQSDTIEPLKVEGSGAVNTANPAPPWTDNPLPRVILEPGMTQPPRPDGEPGRALRMPYADEEGILALPLDPVQRMLKVVFPNLIDELRDAEESEPAQNISPPHHQHCPFHGGYPYRGLPR